MLLKKALFSMFLFCPLVTWGQLLSVTATLTDSDAVVWVNGNCSVELFSPNGQAFYNGTAVPTGPQTCAIDGSGVLTTSIYNTSTITPTGAMYRFIIGSATSAPASQFLTPITAANQTSNLSALITAPRFNSATAFVYGYADVEALHGAPGNQYFKTTATAGQRIWSGSVWTSGGGGGSSGISGLTLNCIPKAATATTITGCAGLSDDGTTIRMTEILQGLMGAATPATAPGSFVNLFLANKDSIGTFIEQQDVSNVAFDSGILTVSLGGSTADSYVLIPKGGSTPVYWVPPDGSSFNLDVPAKIGTNAITSIDPAITVGQSVCVKAAGPPLILGKCTSVVGAGGACTCS